MALLGSLTTLQRRAQSEVCCCRCSHHVAFLVTGFVLACIAYKIHDTAVSTRAEPWRMSLEHSSSPQHVVFMQFGELQLWQQISLVHAKKFHPDAVIVILTPAPADNDGSTIESMWPEVKEHVDIIFPVNLNSVSHMNFKQLYRHSSVNAYDFDFIALSRFFSLQQFMLSYNLPSAIMFDIDIVLFNNAFAILPMGVTCDKYTDYATHWSRQSLDAFCNYIAHFYDANATVVAQRITRFGQRSDELARILDESPVIGAWWPDGLPRRQFGDMYIFDAFLQEQPGWLLVKCWPTCAQEVLPLFRTLRHVLREKGPQCTNASVVQDAFMWKFDSQHQAVVPFLRSSAKRVAGLHFQGNCKASVPGVLCRNTPFLPGCASDRDIVT